MTLSPTSNVTSPPVGSAVWEGQSRAGSPLSIADHAARIQRKLAGKQPILPLRESARPHAAYARKYHSDARLRDLMGARLWRHPHVPAFAVLLRAASEGHLDVKPGGVPRMSRAVPSKLDPIGPEQVVCRAVFAMNVLDPGE